MNMPEQRKRTVLAALISGVIGVALGLLWGWMVQPVEWTDASPAMLDPGFQEEYLRMNIDALSVNGNQALALRRWQDLGEAAPLVLATIVANPGSQSPAAIIAFSRLVQGPGATASTPATTATQTAAGEGDSSLMSYLIIAAAVLVLGAVGYFLVKILRPMTRRKGEATPAQYARELSRQAEVTDYTARGAEPPIAQFVTTYVLGDDLFDDSFSIDSPGGEFLGECGIGISETIGVGDPKKVTAFEVWLFDKNDIQTITKVLMSAHAFNDVATSQRLEAKGEPVLMERGKQISLETAALQMIATVTDVAYGQGALPSQSYLERLTLELAIWSKAAAPEQEFSNL